MTKVRKARTLKYVEHFKFNQVLKDRFFELLKNSYKESTAENYKKYIHKAGWYENYFNKDIYDFTLEDLTEMFGSFGAKSRISLRTQKSAIRLYVNFAKDQGYTTNNLDYFDTIDDSKIEGLLNIKSVNNKILTIDQIRRLARNCKNGQDGALVMLLKEGIKGKRCIDLLNIREQDINKENNTIKVGKRIYNVSEETMVHVNRALSEIIYYPKNGGNIGNTKKDGRYVEKQELLSCDYLFKSTVKKNTSAQLTYNGLIGRFQTIKEVAKNKDITPDSIYESGIIEEINKYLKINKININDLDKEERQNMLKYIQEKYSDVTNKVMDRLLDVMYLMDMYVAVTQAGN